jgi:hypothetical protein
MTWVRLITTMNTCAFGVRCPAASLVSQILL